MNNWYRMMAFIPGYTRNKENLEEMITSNVRIDIERDILPPRIFHVLYPMIVIGKLFVFKFSQKAFHLRIRNYISDFRKKNLSSYKLSDCYQLYCEFDEHLISRWHVPVENDFMVMTFFGILKKICQNEDELQYAIRFKSKTSEQIDKIRSLCQYLIAIPEVNEHIRSGNRSAFGHYVEKDENIKKRLETYFEEYGGRYANELKLESKDIEEDPAGLFELIKLYSGLENSADNRADQSFRLSMMKRYFIRKFQKYASAREEMRLLRSNGFSMMRKLINRIGDLFEQEGKITRSEDIFYLYLDEIFKEELDFEKLISQRKKEYERYREVELPSHFALAEGEPPQVLRSGEKRIKSFEGKACSRGKIRGKIRVFEEFSFPEKIDFDIVVAKHTDPGWTPLLGVAKGLIVEHGGILSHAAIVSRELNLPTVIGIPDIMIQLRTGMEVELDGDKGIITILNGD
jgi:pyruvate,water dikinase